jgi:hypothetical protein
MVSGRVYRALNPNLKVGENEKKNPHYCRIVAAKDGFDARRLILHHKLAALKTDFYCAINGTLIALEFLLSPKRHRWK